MGVAVYSNSECVVQGDNSVNSGFLGGFGLFGLYYFWGLFSKKSKVRLRQ